MKSFRCLNGYCTTCKGSVWFGDIKQPPSTWQYERCRCECHVKREQLAFPLLLTEVA